MIKLRTNEEIETMRHAGRIVALTHNYLREIIKEGITTLELDQLAKKFIESQDCRPAFLGYNGFPGTICASVNEEVVHGIPKRRKLKSGDIIGIDIGVEYKGYFGDAAITYGVGEISEEASKLIRVTKESLYKGLEKAKPGNRLSDISHEIQLHVEDNGFSVVRDFVGHGIGQEMHEDPPIPNYGRPDRGPLLQEGMVLAIEPMVNVGTYRVKVLGDDWTVVTADGSLSAHYEHTIAITKDGYEILTKV